MKRHIASAFPEPLDKTVTNLPDKMSEDSPGIYEKYCNKVLI